MGTELVAPYQTNETNVVDDNRDENIVDDILVVEEFVAFVPDPKVHIRRQHVESTGTPHLPGCSGWHRVFLDRFRGSYDRGWFSPRTEQRATVQTLGKTGAMSTSNRDLAPQLPTHILSR